MPKREQMPTGEPEKATTTTTTEQPVVVEQATPSEPTPASAPDDQEGAGQVDTKTADYESARVRPEDPSGPESGQDTVEATGQMTPGDPADEKPLPPTNPPPQIPPGVLAAEAGSGTASGT